MGGLIILLLLVGYILLFVWLSKIMARFANKKGIKPWKKVFLVCLVLFAGWNLIFWETIPSVVYREYMCRTWAGPKIYKTVTNVKGVEQDDGLAGLTLFTGNKYEIKAYTNGNAYFFSNGELKYGTTESGKEDLNSRTPVFVAPRPETSYLIKRLQESHRFVATRCWGFEIIDKKNNEVLGEFHDCGTGHSGNPYVGSSTWLSAIQNLPMKSGSCFKEKEDGRDVRSHGNSAMRRFVASVLQP